MAPPPKFIATEFRALPRSSGSTVGVTSSMDACIHPSPPTRYGRSDSRVTLTGVAMTMLPPNVKTLLFVNSPAWLSVSKNRGAYREVTFYTKDAFRPQPGAATKNELRGARPLLEIRKGSGPRECASDEWREQPVCIGGVRVQRQ